MSRAVCHVPRELRCWRVIGLALLAGVALLTAPLPAMAQAPPAARLTVQDTADELLVGFEDAVTDAEADDTIRGQGATKLGRIHGIKVHHVRVPPQARDAIERALARRKGVTFVERNKIHSVDAAPNDPSYKSQWQHPKTSAPLAWDITGGSAEIVIAILDTGVDGAHPDLSAKMVPGYNLFDKNTNTSDVHGHGTKVAGMAAATGNNGVGVAGVSWFSRIMPVRVTDSSGFAFTSTIAAGVTYAADHGAKVINISIGGVAGMSSVTSAAKYANGKGTVVVAGAGNCGCTEAIADNLYIISVSATTSSDTLASFSSMGNYVDLAAPGASVYTTARGGTYATVSGTSFSGPFVAGAAALMMAVNPSLTPDDVDALLKANADELGTGGWDPKFGFGRVNVYRAVAAARDSLPSSSSPLASAPPPPDTQPPADVATLTAQGGAVGGQIVLAWTNPTTDYSGTLVLRRQGTTVGDAPAAGQAYSVGQTIGSSTVVLASSATSLADTGLPVNTTYAYKAFSFDAARNYAAGVAASATTPADPNGCPTEVIVDNLAAGASSAQVAFTGTWAGSGLAGFFGANNSLYTDGTKAAAYTWTTPVFSTTASCSYNVFAWWTSSSNRSAAAPYTVSGSSAGPVTKSFDQRSNGGKWNQHGTTAYTFPAGAAAKVQLANNGLVVADAVRFVLTASTAATSSTTSTTSTTSTSTTTTASTTTASPTVAEIIVNNAQPGTTSTGSWCQSSVTGYDNTQTLYSCGSAGDAYRWSPTIATSGAYDVYMWWGASSNRSSAVPVTIGHAAGTASLSVNQQVNGGKWNLLGRFSLPTGSTTAFVQITDSKGMASAGAVRFVYVPQTIEVTSSTPVQQSPIQSQ